MTTSQKTIIISDIHISNGAGYSWFLPPCPDYLVTMLNNIAKDHSVEELVLLGDVFDLWLYPIDVIPWTVSQIIQANPLITKALKQCVQKIPNVYYMNGNHDMAVVPGDLLPFSSGNKSMQWISPDLYAEKYQNRRRLEHGHAADMFNAPDDSIDAVKGYPLGFFVTRLVATAANPSAARQALKAIVQAKGASYKAMGPEAIDALSMGRSLVKAIIDVLELYAELQDSTPIRFLEPDLDKRYTVGDIKSHYGSLYGAWRKLHPDPTEFVDTMLVGFDSNGLGWYAKKLLSGKAAPNVVIMGHTHHAVSQGRYDNDGFWCISNALGHGGAKASYVEIIGDKITLVRFP